MLPSWRRFRNLICLAILASLVLGAFSIRPFTQLLLPWIVFDQWKRATFPAADDTDCIEQMRAMGASFTVGGVPEAQRAQGCAIDTPLVLSSGPPPFVNIAFNPPYEYTTLSCKFALRLRSFIDRTLQTEANRMLGSSVKKFLHKGGYACRGQRTFTSLMSEHAFGEAMDLAGVELEDGRIISVESDYTADSDAGRFLRSIAAAACAEFGTTLGPPFNDLHRDHLHIAVGFPKRCVY